MLRLQFQANSKECKITGLPLYVTHDTPLNRCSKLGYPTNEEDENKMKPPFSESSRRDGASTPPFSAPALFVLWKKSIFGKSVQEVWCLVSPWAALVRT